MEVRCLYRKVKFSENALKPTIGSSGNESTRINICVPLFPSAAEAQSSDHANKHLMQPQKAGRMFSGQTGYG